ncbi:hypothetical protein PHYSODRAFT_340675 [Phytophthora sojae]|uniref:5'-nucleotidase n=1 Tax=Phytophthora sojae (strain P6497) TaxID=1094619 RepID=G5AAI3_PHYSP|nr:hypothetical protein PHYSODRAFT_340675 [Phytophthora sojae]EGZ07612.1 hypothetical protein PHYSODRAFT_340675 [Phytophthora sojae]|eukprot:XP_009537178.1 hypothetical protein PHYSODRAFT_340675 [Phytophthora sojae]
MEEKLSYMIEWWTKEHELMIEQGFTKRTIETAVGESGIAFRERCTQVFDLLEGKSVPTLIFSAGLYDVIHAVLDKEYKKTPAQKIPSNVHMISYMMQFDESGKVVDFKGEHEQERIGTEFWKQCQLEEHRNILLLGDSLGDANIADGLDFTEDEIVRIGFLNSGAGEKLDLYMQRFDIVLTNDSSLLPLEVLLHQFKA